MLLIHNLLYFIWTCRNRCFLAALCNKIVKWPNLAAVTGKTYLLTAKNTRAAFDPHHKWMRVLQLLPRVGVFLWSMDISFWKLFQSSYEITHTIRICFFLRVEETIRGVPQKRCSIKFRKIRRRIPMPEPLF